VGVPFPSDVDGLDAVSVAICTAGFPIAAQASAREFGLNSTDGTQMTLIGGLMYNGGPGANTAMHGLAAMVPKLRAQSGAYGLVYVQSTHVASGPHLPARCSVSQ
jgi:acetyl-CoA C-acetyltransferase